MENKNDILIMRPAGKCIKGLHDLCKFIGDTKDMTIVEIGSYSGESTVIFASYFNKVISVDPWASGAPTMNLKEAMSDMSIVEKEFDKRIAAYDNIVKNKMFSHEFVNTIPNGSIDVVYIDGDHTYDGVTKDINMWLPKVAKGGYICGHDYYSTVKKAVNDTFNKPPTHTFKDSSWVYNEAEL